MQVEKERITSASSSCPAGTRRAKARRFCTRLMRGVRRRREQRFRVGAVSGAMRTQQQCRPSRGSVAVMCHRSACIRGISGVAIRHRSARIRSVSGVAVSGIGAIGSTFGVAVSSGGSERHAACWRHSSGSGPCSYPRSFRPHPGIGCRIGGWLEGGGHHGPSSPPNKRVKSVPCGHPTRKVLRTLLAAYARRWAKNV